MAQNHWEAVDSDYDSDRGAEPFVSPPKKARLTIQHTSSVTTADFDTVTYHPKPHYSRKVPGFSWNPQSEKKTLTPPLKANSVVQELEAAAANLSIKEDIKVAKLSLPFGMVAKSGRYFSPAVPPPPNMPDDSSSDSSMELEHERKVAAKEAAKKEVSVPLPCEYSPSEPALPSSWAPPSPPNTHFWNPFTEYSPTREKLRRLRRERRVTPLMKPDDKARKDHARLNNPLCRVNL